MTPLQIEESLVGTSTMDLSKICQDFDSQMSGQQAETSNFVSIDWVMSRRIDKFWKPCKVCSCEQHDPQSVLV